VERGFAAGSFDALHGSEGLAQGEVNVSVQRIQTIGTRALTTGAPLFQSALSSKCGDSFPERGGGGPRVGAGPCP
jgi:hypothetical protein